MARVSGKKASRKAIFWDEKIRAWQKTNLPQSTYCKLNGLSITAFSKWKKKLHPNLTARHPVYKLKSKYYKFTKIPDQKIETLIRCFLLGTPAKNAAQESGIKQNTIYKFYNDFRLALINGALSYPQLFFHAGPLLMLGPPTHLHGVMRVVGELLPAHKPNNKSAVLRSRRNIGAKDTKHLKSNLQVLTSVFLYYCLYKWTLEEAFSFRERGFRIFYKHVYAPNNNLNPDLKLDDKMLISLYREINNTSVARANWDYWATKNERKPFHEADAQFWTSLEIDREKRFIAHHNDWLKPLFKDFCWILKTHKISDKNQVRSSYWSEFFPTSEAVEQSRREHIKKRLKLFPKTKGPYTITELAMLGELEKENK